MALPCGGKGNLAAAWHAVPRDSKRLMTLRSRMPQKMMQPQCQLQCQNTLLGGEDEVEQTLKWP